MYKGKFAAGNKNRRMLSESAEAPMEAAVEAAEAVAEPIAEPVADTPKPKRKVRLSTIIFYSFFFVLLVSLSIVIAVAYNALNDWLVIYEASQPDNISQQTFDAYFADPDWIDIYEMAGLTDTEYEGAEAFATYMDQRIGDGELTYIKTSAGLSGGHKYIVRNGTDNLLTFTLQNSVTDEVAIPDWSLDTVEVLYARNEYVTVQVGQEHTVSINGVALTDDHVIRTATTVVEDYLPEGVHGSYAKTYYLKGLLTTPTVTVTDADGAPTELSYDAQAKTYTLTSHIQEQVMPDDSAERMTSGIHEYCRQMIGAGNNMRAYFDTNSDIYKNALRRELWFSGYTDYHFTDAEITSIYCYTDSLLSARIRLTLNVERANGTLKPFDVDYTVFMGLKNNNWVITDIINADLQQPRAHVRLTYLVDGEIISSEMVDASSTSVTLPDVTAPEGKVLSGWFRQTVDEAGNTTLTLVFQPSEDGVVALPYGYTLEPMELIARFESEEA